MKKKKKTRYCEHSNNCDKDIDCFNGEDCPVFEHTSAFSSLRFDDDNPPISPKETERGDDGPAD